VKLENLRERREASRGSFSSDYQHAVHLPFGALERIGSTMMSALATKVVLTSTALDCMCFGVALLDGDARVLLLNRVAKQILDDEDGLALVGGRLTLMYGNNAHLAQSLEQQDISRAFRAPKRKSGDYLMLVAPLPLSSDVPLSKAHLVVIDDPASDPPDNADLLGELYELTPAQARLAWHIACGYTLVECAEFLSVSVTTVKSHLRELFAKTDTHRQADLARLLNRTLRLAI